MGGGKLLRCLSLLANVHICNGKKTVSFISIACDVVSSQPQDEGVESPTHTKWDSPTIEHSIVPDDGDDQSLAQAQPVPHPLLSQTNSECTSAIQTDRQPPDDLRF